MSNCKKCGGRIEWAYDTSREKWKPIEPDSLDGTEERFEGSFYFESWHRFHRCTGWSGEARNSQGYQPPPPPAQPPPSKWAAEFATLHLLSTAPPQVIRAAYRALALIHHPDIGGDPARMVAINSAYTKINDSR